MRKTKRTILIAMLICVVTVPVCWARSRRGKAKPVRMSILEILDKFSATQDNFKSFIVKSNSKTKGMIKKPGMPDQEADKRVTSEFRFDGDRSNNRFTSRFKDHNNYNDHFYKSRLWDGTSWYSYTSGLGKPGTLFITRNRVPKREKARFSRDSSIGVCKGYFYGDDERFDTIFREAIRNGEYVSVQDKLEHVNGSNCYVIQARTGRGKVIVWLDPQKDYNIVRAISEKRTGDQFYDKVTIAKGGYSSFKLNVKYKKIGDIWVPRKYEVQIKRFSPGNGYFDSDGRCEFTEILLNPDHDTLGSFVPDDIVDGAKVHVGRIDKEGKREGPPTKYIWQDGAVVDEDGQVVDLKKSIYETKNIGK